jgi:hypothetical protein
MDAKAGSRAGMTRYWDSKLRYCLQTSAWWRITSMGMMHIASEDSGDGGKGEKGREWPIEGCEPCEDIDILYGCSTYRLR